MNKILASALVVMIAVSATGFWYIQNRTDKPLFQSPASKEANQLLSGKFDVAEAPEESFGDLDKVSIVNAEDAAKLNSSKSSSNTSTEIAATPTSSDQPVGGGMSASMGEDAKMIAPGEPYPMPETYNFVYDGKDITSMLEKTQPVLKRRIPVETSSLADKVVNLLSFGLIDLHQFHNLKVQYMSFVEDRDYGYGLSIDLMQGSVSMSQNWEKWPQPVNYECLDQYCNPDGEKFTLDTYPKDSNIIQVADAFLKEYGISREAYGAPQILDQQWRVLYKNMPESEKVNFYFPEQVSVVYPLNLQGKLVYDEGGNLSGLNVQVDVRQNRVIGLYDLTTKQFEKSNYAGEVDPDRILKFAQNGGFRNYNYVDPGAKLVTLKLDTPTLQMERIWYSSMDPKTGQYTNGGELYVPALVFQIKNQGNYWRKNVIVPLVRDILDSEPTQEQPIPVDLPPATSSETPAVISTKQITN